MIGNRCRFLLSRRHPPRLPQRRRWRRSDSTSLAVGTDAVVRHLSWTNGSWNPWEDIDGTMTYGPTAIAPAPDRIEVFGPGNDQAPYDHGLYQRSWNGTGVGTGHMGSPAMCGYLLAIASRSTSVQVDTARSLITDTDYGQCSVQAGNWPIRTANQSIDDSAGPTRVSGKQTCCT